MLTLIPALPFCSASLVARWRSKDYPIEIRHLGDHIRRRRAERRLLQSEVAIEIGAHEHSVHHWETGQTKPALRYLPGIIRFLGYDPRPLPEGVGPQLRHYRQGRGISQVELARELQVDPGTLASWEGGLTRPWAKAMEDIRRLLGG